MEENIIISNLNDFIFCPRSIYFHNLYSGFDEGLYHSHFQVEGKIAHERIDSKTYSSKKAVLESVDVFSEELGLVGKIDLYDIDSKKLIERKKLIKKIYEGYYLQLYAQYFCMVEMGYVIKSMCFHSLQDNKTYDVPPPGADEKEKLKRVISEMRSFDLSNPNFSQNPAKCKMCIYNQLCDYYKG